jgi:ribonuclease Z
MSPGQLYEVRRDFGIRAYQTHHGGPSLGYGAISIREKLKTEYMGIEGRELAAMKKRGIEIQYRLEVPLVVFLGDTTAGEVFDQSDVQNAEILITECTFYDAEHRTKAKAGRHLHIDQFATIVPRLKNQHIVLTHVSRRTGIRRATHLLRKKIGDERMKNILFLMDFEGSLDAGDVEDAGPNPRPDTPE